MTADEPICVVVVTVKRECGHPQSQHTDKAVGWANGMEYSGGGCTGCQMEHAFDGTLPIDAAMHTFNATRARRVS